MKRGMSEMQGYKRSDVVPCFVAFGVFDFLFQIDNLFIAKKAAFGCDIYLLADFVSVENLVIDL